MPKISRAGPTNDGGPQADQPEAAAAQARRTPADVLRDRGHLGPYGDVPTVGDVQAQPAAQTEDTAEGQFAADDDVRELTDDERKARDAAEQDAQPEGGGPVEAEGPAGQPKRPNRNASRADWVTYVETVHGVPVPDDVKRDELVELYGNDE
jgi:hypothetical protein